MKPVIHTIITRTGLSSYASFRNSMYHTSVREEYLFLLENKFYSRFKMNLRRRVKIVSRI